VNSLVLHSIYERASKTPGIAALSSGETVMNYHQLAQRIGTFIHRLHPYKGKCLAIEMENSPDWVIADLACVEAGVVTVPIPPFFTPEQRLNALSDAGVRAIIGEDLELLPLSYSSENYPKGTSKITYTSGSTGTPKGVCLSQEGMEQVAVSLMDVIGVEAAGLTAALLPLGVLLENVSGCYATLLAGGCYDVRPQNEIGLGNGGAPDFGELAQYLATSKATSCILVPELLRGLMQALAYTKTRLPAMQFMAVGGSKVSSHLLQNADLLGLPVYQGYGLSECSSVVAVNTPAQHDISSVGKVLPHSNIAIAEDGEIIINNPAFLGYLGEVNATKQYATGDLGTLDDHGFLHVTGRKKNLLITAYGRNVSPEWPESELLSQPEIMQCIVFGDAAPHLAALIVPSLSSTSDVMLQKAIDQTNQSLPEYAQINTWQKVLPFTVREGLLTGTGRPRRTSIFQAHNSLIKALSKEDSYANIL